MGRLQIYGGATAAGAYSGLLGLHAPTPHRMVAELGLAPRRTPKIRLATNAITTPHRQPFPRNSSHSIAGTSRPSNRADDPDEAYTVSVRVAVAWSHPVIPMYLSRRAIAIWSVISPAPTTETRRTGARVPIADRNLAIYPALYDSGMNGIASTAAFEVE